MSQSLARLQWPLAIQAGDVVKVRLLVQHPMHTGYQQDMQGRLIARNVLVWLTCTLDGQQVFRVEPSSGIAANPYFEFFVRARTSSSPPGTPRYPRRGHAGPEEGRLNALVRLFQQG